MNVAPAPSYQGTSWVAHDDREFVRNECGVEPSGWVDIRIGNHTIGSMYSDDFDTNMKRAQLASAAPDMLAALRAMILNDPHTYRDCHKAALAAIAKAEGR